MSFDYNTPIQFLPGIGKRTAKVLLNLDVRTVEELHRIPSKILIELFGPSILLVLKKISLPKSHPYQPKKYQKKMAATPTNQFARSKSVFHRLSLAAKFLSFL